MKVTNIDVIPANSSYSINLSFRDPISQNVYVAKGILGLDADEITPKYYASGLLGDRLYDLSLKNREIVLQISLNPNFEDERTYAKLRDDIYKIVASSRTGTLQLRFKDGLNVVAAISGFVTKVESPAFTKTPEVHVTIRCDKDPWLRAVDYVNVNLEELNPASTVVTDDMSTAPHGFSFGVVFMDTAAALTIKESVFPTWFFEVFLTGSSLVEFVAGDKVYFSSEFNNKYLYLERDSEIFHLVDKLMPNPVWPILFPGDNTLICPQPVNWEYIRYYPTYWGV
jgi:hypothetical protein